MPWIALLDGTRWVNPLLRDVLMSMQHDRVTTPAEYATDLVFKSRAQLADFVPGRLDHSPLGVSARDAWKQPHSNDGMDSSRDLNGIACQSRLASKVASEGGAR